MAGTGGDILQRIVETKKEEVAKARKKLPEKRLREMAEKRGPGRGFFMAMEKPGPYGINIIAEIKRASPSKGDIAVDLDPASLASDYRKGGAAAISVLTDELYFKGSLADFDSVRKVSDLPLLRKDFTILPYQIYESAVRGADAVLLIVRILSEARLSDYLFLCRDLGLDALVETHTEKDIEAATRAGAKLLGINNRNLKTFETDIEIALEKARLLSGDQIAVAESGISGPEDISRLREAGIFNFLIRESLVRADDKPAFLKSLMEAGKGQK